MQDQRAGVGVWAEGELRQRMLALVEQDARLRLHVDSPGAPAPAVWLADAGRLRREADGSRTALRSLARRAPVIVLADAAREPTALQLVAEGAEDYLIWDELDGKELFRRVSCVLARSAGRLASNEAQLRHELAVLAGTDGVWDWDLVSGKVHYSSRWKGLLGFAEHEIGDTPVDWLARVHPDDRERVESERMAHLEGNTPGLATEHRVMHRDGSYRWMLARGIAARDERGAALRLTGILRDVSERRDAEEQLRQGAFYDALTGLPNRNVLLDRLGRSIEQARRRGDYVFAVLFIDLDGFKLINDSLGHAAGDALLVTVARRLETCVRTVDTLARLGGDEFAIILDNIRDISDALRVAERIHRTFVDAFEIGSEQVFVSGSIGIALSVAGYERAEEIVRDADIAMYRAKGKGKACHEIFDETMHSQAVDRLRLETDLRRALEQEELRVHYQPIVCITTGRVVGFEALVRWQHPEHGLVSPARFIPVAEQCGLIIPLDRWVLGQACRQMAAWQRRYSQEPPLTISVNLSPKQLTRPDLLDLIRDVLDESGLDPRSFRPEITESVLMEDLDAASEILDRLKDMDVLLHMDDFGTGYSSLSYLVRFRVSTLKIDGSFVSHMESGGESVEIVRMIVALAHNLGMKVIAEGVETEAQLEQLRRLNCAFGQGYLFSKALPAEEAEALLAQPTPWSKPAAAPVV